MVNDTWFDTLTVAVPGRAAEVVAAARTHGLHLRLVDADHVGLSTSERTTPVHRRRRAAGLRRRRPPTLRAPNGHPERRWLGRSAYLTHEVFNSHHSETQMLRYLRRLSARDYALDRGMIPLGSCTMKLNATTEMEPVSLPGLRRPAPLRARRGRRRLPQARSTTSRAGWPRSPATTGSRSSPTPARRASSPGCWRSAATTSANGDTERDVCLIPSSAHGTNAASAVMAGMKVVVVKAADDGSVDLDDLQAPSASSTPTRWPRSWSPTRRPTGPTRTRSPSCARSCTTTAARSTSTAPTSTRCSASPSPVSSAATCRTSTCTRPSASRTAAAARASVRSRCGPTWRRTCPRTPCTPRPTSATGIGPISAAPYGSAGILPISWAYIRLMGGAGLTRATAVAVLSANYIAHRLGEHFPVLYRGHGGWSPTSASSTCAG